ncbi:hypothetical protein A2W14_05535 [Candidatus Gottesmanbacteria bacterium RBG_16_37_8]|uniref:Uncharacterized protein n=1 Tax=Candidatus Gottesmanbacteria bacterium RBG_16_37_8 TaxID=1798371 RepID=A0A1F5YVI3_9BACT|nr:MAG: hypothetical protein A2W14_05535 [Candidatus Gottesmanbacteria bacterium RBG_16_37_8]
MKNDYFYQRLVDKMQQMAVIPPQTVGPLTPLYKRLVPQFKFFPFKILIPASFVAIIFAYLIFGLKLVKLASLLQLSF